MWQKHVKNERMVQLYHFITLVNFLVLHQMLLMTRKLKMQFCRPIWFANLLKKN